MRGSERSWRGGSSSLHQVLLIEALALAGALGTVAAGLGQDAVMTEDFETQEVDAFPSGWSDLADVVSLQDEVLAVVKDVPGPDGEPTRALEVTSRHGVSQGIYRRVRSGQGTYRLTVDAYIVQDMPRGFDNIPIEVTFATLPDSPGDPYYWTSGGLDCNPGYCSLYTAWSPLEQQGIGQNVAVNRWYKITLVLDVATGVVTGEVADLQGGGVAASGSAVFGGLVGRDFNAVYIANQHRGAAGQEAITLFDNISYSDPAEGLFPDASCALVDPPEECYLVGQIVRVDGSASTTPEGSEIISWAWDFGDGTTAEDATAGHAYDRCGRYQVALLVTNDKGATSVAKTTICVVAPVADPGTLAPWTATQVGTPGLPGGIGPVGAAEPGCYAVCVGGRGLVGAADECLLLGQSLEGDGTVSAHVLDQNGGASGAGMGVMVRGNLEPDSAFVALCFETRAGLEPRCALYHRPGDGEPRKMSGSRTFAVDSSSAWVRVRRAGDVYIGEASEDGLSWIPVGEELTIAGLVAPIVGATSYGRDMGTAPTFQGLEARVCALEWTPAPPGGPAFRRGDSNCDGSEDLSDATATFNHLFLGGEAPCCLRAADVNRDDALDISDGVALLNFLFLGGEAPAEPFGACGRDDDATLGCERYPPCP